MNTMLLAAVAIGLVAFLIFNRKRQASPGAAEPKKERTPARSRARAKSRRGGAIQGYPDAPEAPTAAAVAETAASRSLSPVLEPLPPAAPAPPPMESAPSTADWSVDGMIVEPGWPMPGEIAGTWSAPAPVDAPVAPAPDPVAEEPATDVATDVATEWAMPAPAVEIAPAPEPEPQREPEPETYGGSFGESEPAMDTWFPGVSEVEPVVLPDADAPETPAAPEPDLVWADASPAADGPVTGPAAWTPADAPPVEGAVAEPAEEPVPPVWEPAHVEAFSVPGPEPEPEPVAVEPVVDEPLVTPFVAEAVPVADVEPWQPIAEPVNPPSVEPFVRAADLEAQIDEVAEGLPEAVAALTPILAACDALGVTPRMSVVLRALADRPRGLPELARGLGVSRPVVADVCARLEDLELVWRERDPDDRRRVLVVPTEQGLKHAEEAVPGLDRDAVADALGRLSAAELAALVSAVRALRAPDPSA